MTPSPTPGNAQVLPLTLTVMDRAEVLARQTFEEQGLPLPASKVTTAVEAIKQDVKALSSIPTAQTAEEGSGPSLVSIARRMVMPLLVSGLLASLFLLWGILSSPSQGNNLSDAEVVAGVRSWVANMSTEDLKQLLASTSGKEGEWAQALKSRGTVQVRDLVGHPEVTWGGVSEGVCRALVEDIYSTPSIHGVVVAVDGQSTGVTCAGPTHTITLGPHL